MPRPRSWRPRVAVASLALAPWLALAACGDDARPVGPRSPPAPSAASETRAVPSPTPAPAAPPAPAPTSAPAAKGPRTPEELAALTTRDVAGFQRTSQRSGKSHATMTFEGTTPNAGGYHVFATVRVEACVFCAKMDVEAWRANENLKRLLPSAHLTNPALVFQVDALDLGGRTGIAIFKESFVESTSASGTTRSSSYGLQVWFNDGVHQILVEVSPRGPELPGSLEALRASMTRAELEAAARALFAAYADVF